MVSKLLRWCLATAILLLGVAWVQYDIGWPVVLAAWSQLSVVQLLLLGMLTMASYMLRAWRIVSYFASLPRQDWPQILRISLLHNALNNFLPMRLGEASFPLLMRRQFAMPLLESGAGLLWIRLADLHTLLMLLALVLTLQFGGGYALLLAGLAVLPLVAPAGLSMLRRRVPSRWRQQLELASRYAPTDRRQWLNLYGLTVLVWLSKLSALALVLLAFVPITPEQAMLAVISADLSSVLPIHGLAGSGTFEAAVMLALAPFELPRQPLLLAAVNLHLYLLAMTVLSLPVALAIPPRRRSQNAP